MWVYNSNNAAIAMKGRRKCCVFIFGHESTDTISKLEATC